MVTQPSFSSRRPCSETRRATRGRAEKKRREIIHHLFDAMKITSKKKNVPACPSCSWSTRARRAPAPARRTSACFFFIRKKFKKEKKRENVRERKDEEQRAATTNKNSDRPFFFPSLPLSRARALSFLSVLSRCSSRRTSRDHRA